MRDGISDGFNFLNLNQYGALFSFAALIIYFVVNLLLLDTATKFETPANPSDPRIFTIHFLIAITLIFIVLGLLLVGIKLEALTCYELIRNINNN